MFCSTCLSNPAFFLVYSSSSLIRIAAGQNTTVFLAKPTSPKEPSAITVSNGDPDSQEESEDKYSDMPRHPEELEDVPEFCLVCSKDNGEDDSPLECDKVHQFSQIRPLVIDIFG